MMKSNKTQPSLLQNQQRRVKENYIQGKSLFLSKLKYQKRFLNNVIEAGKQLQIANTKQKKNMLTNKSNKFFNEMKTQNTTNKKGRKLDSSSETQPLQTKRLSTQSNSISHMLDSDFVNTSFVGNNCFEKNPQLVNFYGKNVFAMDFKFQRFTSILKKKYNSFCFNEPNTSTSRNKTYRTEQAQFSLKSRILYDNISPKDKQKANNFEPKLKPSQRPSSGVSLQKGQLFIKKKKIGSALGQFGTNSVTFNHINALYKKDNKRQKVTNQNNIKYSSKFQISSYLKQSNLKNKNIPRYPVYSDQMAKIDPWEDQIPRIKNISDLEISVKL